MRVAILGNSGSGKSTLAAWIAARAGAAHLDLDTIAWEPATSATTEPVLRDEAAARADVRRFCLRHPSWVVEGCYTALVAAALAYRPTLLFLNPGVEACVANCRSRPWEAHKYASPDEQDTRLQALLAWVRSYPTRTDGLSLAAHAACFSAYDGPKHELRTVPDLLAPDPKVLERLR